MSVLTIPACQPQEKKSSILSRILLACTSQTDMSVLRVDFRLTYKLSLSLWHLSRCPSITKADKRRISWITSIPLFIRIRRCGEEMLVGLPPAITVTSFSMLVPARTTLGGPSLRPTWAFFVWMIALTGEMSRKFLLSNTRPNTCLMLTTHEQRGVGCKRYSR